MPDRILEVSSCNTVRELPRGKVYSRSGAGKARSTLAERAQVLYSDAPTSHKETDDSETMIPKEPDHGVPV